METSLTPTAYPIAVTDPLAVRPYDYADAFAAGSSGSPVALGPETSAVGGLLRAVPERGWVWREPEPARADGCDGAERRRPPIERGARLIARNLTSTRRTLTTVVSYTRPRLGWLVMTLIGPVHRRLARRLVAGSGRTPARTDA